MFVSKKYAVVSRSVFLFFLKVCFKCFKESEFLHLFLLNEMLLYKCSFTLKLVLLQYFSASPCSLTILGVLLFIFLAFVIDIAFFCLY